ncbi:MAG: riboflavin biosynthesis protein RibD [Bacteroidetes bacterium 4572_77]|nr:MAG: riboflavin biosynthesis protein RibD [Bacteroidetes bacterium 4572_77]
MNLHEKIMSDVLDLAKKGKGNVSPNPLVGCVITKNGKVISQGFHEKFGEAHAERKAILAADKSELDGAELYVNLEPCCHHGKTPPCTDLIIESKIKKVFVGMQDPNPLVAGKGITQLISAGIEVETGILEKEAKFLNRAFIKNITKQEPYVILKMGISLDGFIATSTGESQWITCQESRKQVHKLRAEVDAVLVGKNTAVLDKPQLNVRHIDGRDPKKVIIDSHLKVLDKSEEEKSYLKDAIIYCIDDSKALENHFIDENNIKIKKLNEVQNRPSLNELLKDIYSNEKIGMLLVEGGAELASSFIEQDLADEILIYIAPMILGNGKNVFAGFDAKQLANAKKFEVINHQKIGDDVLIQMVK